MRAQSLRLLVRKIIRESVDTAGVTDPDVQEALIRLLDADDLRVEIKDASGGNRIIFTVVRFVDQQEFTGTDDFVLSFSPVSSSTVLAKLELIRDSSRGPCHGAWEVSMAHAYESGMKWGRLLYDVAMEKLGLIMSDRESVSNFARPVWTKIRARGDIKRVQLDDKFNTLTPSIEEDNCEIAPWSFVAIPGKDYDIDPGYRASAEYINRLRTGDLSAAYSKGSGSTPVLDALRSSGKIKE